MFIRYLVEGDSSLTQLACFSSDYSGPISVGDVHLVGIERMRVLRAVYELKMNTIHIFVERLDAEKRSSPADTQGRDNKGSRK